MEESRTGAGGPILVLLAPRFKSGKLSEARSGDGLMTQAGQLLTQAVVLPTSHDLRDPDQVHDFYRFSPTIGADMGAQAVHSSVIFAREGVIKGDLWLAVG
jgi:hypothetical protein